MCFYNQWDHKILRCEYHGIESVNINGIRISPRKFGFCQWRYQSPESPVSLSGFRFFSAEAEQAEELYFTYLFNVSSADREAGDAFQKCLITHSP
jgi:hypothetical protein